MIEAQLGRPKEALRTFQQFRDRMQAVLADDPRNVDARLWMSSALHNLGETFVDLGRPAEASAPLPRRHRTETRLDHVGTWDESRRALAVQPLSRPGRGPAPLGLPADAAATLRDHQELWAGDPDAIYEMACGLSLCIPLVGKGRNGSSPEQAAERKKYGDSGDRRATPGRGRGFS